MADIEFIIPGGGIVNDTEEGFEPNIPGVGIYQEQPLPAVGGPSHPLIGTGGLIHSPLFDGSLIG